MLPFAPLLLKGDEGMFMYIFNNVFCSLILRSERLIPVSFLYRLYIY